MIFVTVGTHEQPFNRLIKEVDSLKHMGIIKDHVFSQIGYSTYIPKFCEYQKFVSYNEMDKLMSEASIIITHGGPSSFIKALEYNKIPIVVPRQKKFNEHINDHQLIFCRELKQRKFPIKVVENEKRLCGLLKKRNDNFIGKFNSNNQNFNYKLNVLVDELFSD